MGDTVQRDDFRAEKLRKWIKRANIVFFVEL